MAFFGVVFFFFSTVPLPAVVFTSVDRDVLSFFFELGESISRSITCC